MTFRRNLFILIVWLFPSGPVPAVEITELVAERVEAEYGAELPGNTVFDVIVPEMIISEAEFITQFWLDRPSGRFVAVVSEESGNLWKVSGIAIAKVRVPIATRRLMPGEIIREIDLATDYLPLARVNTYAVRNSSELVGMQVRRALSKGRPIQKQSVTPPIIILRGSIVTIQLARGALYLSAHGKALADAYLEQEVRVVNLESNKTITAVAKSEGVVEIKQ